MRTDGRRYYIQRWELMKSDTIYRDENGCQAIRYKRLELMAGDAIYGDGKWLQAIR